MNVIFRYHKLILSQLQNTIILIFLSFFTHFLIRSEHETYCTYHWAQLHCDFVDVRVTLFLFPCLKTFLSTSLFRNRNLRSCHFSMKFFKAYTKWCIKKSNKYELYVKKKTHTHTQTDKSQAQKYYFFKVSCRCHPFLNPPREIQNLSRFG